MATSFFKKIFSLSRKPSTKSTSHNATGREFIESRLGIPIHRFDDLNSYLDAGTNKVWATFRACHIVSCVLLSTQFKLIKQKGGEDASTLFPDAAKFLKNPNPHDSWEEVIYQWTWHMKLCGQAFWYKSEMDLKGRPKDIFPLLPQYVKIVPDKYEKIKGFVYSINGREIYFDSDEIIMFKRPSPKSTIEGLGDMQPAEPLFNQFINQDTFQEKFMENGAQLSGILSLDREDVEQTEWEKMVEFFKKNYTGKTNAGKVGFLNGKWNYNQLGITMADMQHIESSKMTVEQIFLTHGVPLSVAGFSNASNYATARIDDLNFRKYECVPLIDILVGKLNGNTGFVKPFSQDIQVDYNLNGLIDVEQVNKDYGPLVKVGAMTLNELREMAGLPKSTNPMLDQYFIESSLQPIEMAGLSNPTDDDIKNIVKHTQSK